MNETVKDTIHMYIVGVISIIFFLAMLPLYGLEINNRKAV